MFTLQIRFVMDILSRWVLVALSLLLHPILLLRDTMHSMHTQILIPRRSFRLISKTSRIHLQVIYERYPNMLKIAPMMTSP